MKKLLIMLCMAIMAIAIHATNKISLSSVVGQPTEEVQVDVSLENSDAIAAIEIKIPLDENMTYVDGSIEMNSARSNGHAISAGEVDKELRIYIYSFSLNSIVGNEGKLCSFKLKLKREPAVYTLQPTVVLSNATGSAITAETVAGSVTISAPKLEITTKNIDFGHIPIRSSYTKSVTLKNVGTSVLSVSSITIDDTDFAFSEMVFSIEAGASKTLTLQYNPENWGAISRTITVVSDAMNGKQTASVVADPFSVNELHVAQVSGIADSIVAVPITMNNMEPIVAAQFSFKLPTTLVYDAVELSSRATNHIAMGSMSGDTLMVMIFSPTNEALLGVDGEICRVKLRLDGRSGWYYLEPLNVLLSNIDMVNMTSATSQGRVQIKSPTLSSNATFTIPAAITNVASGQYAIRNSGQAPLTIERVTFLAEGYRVVDELPIVVATGKTQNITIEYTPTKEGKYTTTMQVYTNDPDNRMKSVAVSGDIYEPNSLSLSGIIVDSKYKLKVAMNNYSDIVAMQFDIHWLAGMATNNSLLETTFRINGHTCSITKVGDADYRVVVFSLNNASILGNNGDVISISFEGMSPEDYNNSTITVDNIILSNRSGVNKISTLTAQMRVELYKLTLNVNDENMGSVEGAGFYGLGTEVLVSAIPNEGYHFVRWSDGDTNATRSIIVTSDVTLIAEFVYTVTLSAENGTVTGAGEYAHGTEVTLTATPNEGYHFVRWSDGDTNATRSIIVTSDVTLIAEFAINVYTVTLSAENGVVTDSGEYAHGTEVTLTATPNEGYHFVRWSDGETTSTRTITVTDNVTLTAEFTINVYTVTLTAENGTVTGSGEYNHGTEVTLTATPAEGYHFVKWSDKETNATRTIKVTADLTLTAEFAINIYTVTLIAENGTVTGVGEYNHGTEVTLTATPNEGYHFVKWSDGETTSTRTIIVTDNVTLTAEFTINVYTVTLTAENGTVTGSGEYNHGTEVTLTATPAEGYHFVKWSDEETNATRTIKVTADLTLTAEFAINVYTVTLIAENGTVTGSGEYNHGTEVTLTATPNKGYEFVQWSDNITEASRMIIVTEDINLTAEFRAISIGTNINDTQNQKIRVYTQNQTLYIEGVTDDYHVLDMTGNVIYYGQSSVVTLPCGIYIVVTDNEYQKVIIR